ncbi:chemotaxis protein CheX [Bacillus fengqiuensis]|nr:chemotaxis protein CheX [Bacillus fengqiuensis]
MTLANSLEHLLKSAISSFQTMVPVSITIESASLPSTDSIFTIQHVHIGLTGDVSGSLIIKGEESTFSNLAQSMFGMEVEGAMLQSFTCELGNMIAGNLATEATNAQVSLDITTPSLYENAIAHNTDVLVSLPLKFQNSGYLHVSISAD